MTSMNSRAHIGLKELCNVTSSVKSLLGPLKSYKFIYDQDTQESTLTCSAFRLLENLDLRGAVGQLLYESVQSHHKTYKTGTTTLFFLIGAWSKAALECLDQGVPLSLIVSIMLEGLNSCIEIVESLQINIDNVLIPNANPNKQIPVQDESNACIPSSKCHSASCTDQPVTSGFHHSNHLPENRMPMKSTHTPSRDFRGHACQMNRLTHSRHFSMSNRSCFHSSGSTLPTNNHTLMKLTRSLSHGNMEAMSLVEEAILHLCESTEAKSVTKNLFQASRLELCILKGHSEMFSCAFSGYTTLVAAEYYALVKHLEGKSLKALLVEGEVAENYRHVGFNKATNVRSIAEIKSSEKSGHDLSWISTVCRKITQAGIDVVLVTGDVCQTFIMQCQCRGILVIPRVRQNVLQAFSECTGAEMVTYITQMNCNSIACNVYVSICMRGSSILECTQGISVNLRAKGLNLVTAVVSCRLPAKVQILQDEFWACTYRIHHALHNQKVFPGGGAVELLCLGHLRKLEEMVITFISDNRQETSPSSWLSTTAVHYKGYVYKCLADGFYKYLSVLFCNTGEYSSELEAMTFIENELKIIRYCPSPSSYILKEYVRKPVLVDGQELPSINRHNVYDNVTSKLEAWRRSLHLVLTVLQSDAEIITGSAAHTHIVKEDFITGEHLFL